MTRTIVALAFGLGLALAADLAAAQESRGYGGPLNVGPNFEKGGQHAPPVYGKPTSKPRPAAANKERQAPKRERSAGKPREAPEAKSAESGAAESAADSASSAVPIESDASANSESGSAESASTDCKRFNPTVGQTVSVPCE